MAREEGHDQHGQAGEPENRPGGRVARADGASPTPSSARREISTQHRQLDALLQDCQRTLDPSSGESPSMELVWELNESMEAHFAREESLYYPTLWALRPEVKASLKRLVDSHDDFRARLASVALDVRAGSIMNAAVGLDQLTQLFRQHETAEERILDSLCPGEAARA